jgi:hypothetical protein
MGGSAIAPYLVSLAARKYTRQQKADKARLRAQDKDIEVAYPLRESIKLTKNRAQGAGWCVADKMESVGKGQ